MHIDEEAVCDACRYADKKEEINWKAREEELVRLLDKHRRIDGHYDCIVPGSGGKDSAFAAHVLKYRYGMHPLTVTWPPTLYTEYGWTNFKNWIEVGGFDNVTFKPNGRVHRRLTQLAVQRLLHPFQTFILGQKFIAVKMALRYQVPLIFYGESEAEYGNPRAEAATPLRDKSYHSLRDLSDVHLGGVLLPELIEKHGLTLNDLSAYLPADDRAIQEAGIEVHYLGYYTKWTPQEAFYYAVEHTGFQPRPFRTEGTYSKYNSIDDKIDDLHYYTTYIKFGLGRASYDASQEIRNKHLTREEGVALVRKFDGELPQKYFADVMDYLEMAPEYFMEHCDAFRSPHLWAKRGGDWVLRHPVA
jgi:N-acetyl sugar amidotransferase